MFNLTVEFVRNPESGINYGNCFPTKNALVMDGSRPCRLFLELGAWNYASGIEKMLRLKEHIEYGAERGSLDVVDQFIRSLNDDDWYSARK